MKRENPKSQEEVIMLLFFSYSTWLLNEEAAFLPWNSLLVAPLCSVLWSIVPQTVAHETSLAPTPDFGPFYILTSAKRCS